MYSLLDGLRIVEASSFVACPTATLYLSQMGAEIIRVDQINGGPDYRRWPQAENGDSFYWEGLNKGKLSVALDLSTGEGRELLVQIAAAPGKKCGVFLTNFPVDGFLSWENLSAKRNDIILTRIIGRADGGPALDYTVASALGIPFMTGPQSLDDEPVNAVLPAWDLLTGAYAAFATLAAIRHRDETGQGQEVRIPLADVGIATIGNLGQIAETLHSGNRKRCGNDVFGAFGRDFKTADGERFMLMAITPRQWRGLVEVLNIEEDVKEIERARNVSFAHDEGQRFIHRDLLYPLVERVVATRDSKELAAALDRKGCCWGPYKQMDEAVRDRAMVRDNPLFETVKQPSGAAYPAPGSMATLPAFARKPVRPAPVLGADSEHVLTEVAGLSHGAFAALVDRNIVGVSE